jgi:hypothetical protein
MLGLYGGEDLDVIFNTVIFISKWEIWKIRNKVKYNQSRIGDQTIFNTWKNNFKKHLQCENKHISYSFVFTFHYNIHNWTIQLLPCISFMFINNKYSYVIPKKF